MMEEQKEFSFTYPDQTTKDADSAAPFTFTINLDDHPYDYNLGSDFTINIRPPYRYREDDLIRGFEQYLQDCYDADGSDDELNTAEFMIKSGNGSGYLIGNILKHAQRYNKNETNDDSRNDLLKVMHYALLQLYVHDLRCNENKNDSSSHTTNYSNSYSGLS